MNKLKLWVMNNPFKSFALLLIGYILLATLTLRSAHGTEFDVKAFLDKTYITVGVGYKVQETKLYHTNSYGSSYVMNDPITARIDIGYQYSKNLTFGISHHSQYFTNAPFNNREEYAKTELFIDYKFHLGDLF